MAGEGQRSNVTSADNPVWLEKAYPTMVIGLTVIFGYSYKLNARSGHRTNPLLQE
jgi:hypothetical protein